MVSQDLGIPNIIQTYFFSGYTVFNTLVYGIILIIILFGIIKLFEKIEIDPSSIIYSLIPFIFLGSGTRALVDNGIYPYNIFLITPGIYFLVGFAAISSLLIGTYLYRKKGIDYRYTIFLIGSALTIPTLLNIPYLNIIPIIEILSIWIFFTIIFLLLGKIWDLYNNKINLSIISSHLFDGISTFIAVDYFGYYEQHVLPGTIYNIFRSAITMIPLKIIVITFALYVVDKYIEDKQINGLLKLTIFVLGLAPGLRNFLSLAIGTFI